MVDFNQFMQQQANSAASGVNAISGAANYGQPQVYWGQKPGGYDPARDSLRAGIKPKGPQLRSVDESAISFYSEWSDEERQAWSKRMYANGFIRDPGDMEGAFQAWTAAVKRASDIYSFSGKKVTPWDAMSMMEGSSGSGGRGGANQPKTTTNKSTSYDIPSKEDVAGMVTSVFKGALGRAPSDGELSRYTSMLVKKARQNPRVTTTTQTTDPNGNSTSSSSSRGGYSGEAAQYDAMQRAQADPEYGAYQAATTYFNALVNALGAPG